MANGLFGMSPEQVRMLEKQQRAQDPMQALFGNIFNLGHAAGNAAIRGIFDADTRSPTEKKAAEMQKLRQGVDITTPDGLKAAAAKFQAAGFPELGITLMNARNNMPKTTKQRVEWVKAPDLPGMRFPQIKSQTFLGSDLLNEEVSLGAGQETMKRLIEKAGLRSETKVPKFTGHNIRVGENMLPVWVDEKGVGYIPDATKPDGRDYESVLNNKNPMQRVNFAMDTTVTDKVKRDRALAVTAVKLAVKSKDGFFKGALRSLFDLDADEIKLTAVQLQMVATPLWEALPPEERKQTYGNNITNFMTVLLKGAENEDGSLNINHPMYFTLAGISFGNQGGTVVPKPNQNVRGKTPDQSTSNEGGNLGRFTIKEKN